MNILDTYVVSTTDKLDLGLNPNEPYYIKKLKDLLIKKSKRRNHTKSIILIAQNFLLTETPHQSNWHRWANTYF